MKTLITLIIVLIGTISFSQDWTTFTYQELGMSHQYFRLDKATNSVWIGSPFIGLKKIDEGIISDLYSYDDLSGTTDFNTVQDIYVNDDTVYGIDDFEGLFMIENGNFTVLSSNITYGTDVFMGNEDTIWVATSGINAQAFYGFKNSNYNLFNTVNTGVGGAHVSQIIEDSYGRVWCVHGGVGISYRENGGSWSWDYFANSGLPITNVNKVIQDKEGGIWGTTTKGLCKYDEVIEDWIVYDKSNTNLPSEYITEIDFDSQGRMWIIMEDTALAYSYNYTDWTIYDENNSPISFGDGLPKQLLIDTLDNVWVKDWYDLKILGSNGWLSTIEKIRETTISLYPNPSTTLLNINGVATNTTYTIFNVSGQQHVLNQITNNQLNIEHLTKGTYFLHIKSEQGVEVKRFVKQ